MPNIRMKRSEIFLLLVFFFSTSSLAPAALAAYPATFTDDSGSRITFDQKPSRVVSLVPSVTEILFRIGAGGAVKGVTYHSTYPPEAATREIVGGFFSPSLKRIEALHPDTIFYARIQKKHLSRLVLPGVRLVCLEPVSITDSYRVIEALGRLFDCESASSAIVTEIRGQLELISRKVDRIPQADRKRVMRLMGRERVMTPGDDSFQNDMIRAAGGIPPKLGKNGSIVPMVREQFIRFNPQVIYACGADRKIADWLLQREGWKNVEAVRKHRIYYFPCDLTCRVATNTGYFVTWLSSRIYREVYRQPQNYVSEEGVLDAVSVPIDLSWVKNIRIVNSRIADFRHKTLLIDFSVPMTVVSTLEGLRSDISAMGNHYMPPPYWGFGRLPDIRRDVFRALNKSGHHTALLITGADMDHLAVQKKSFRDLAVWALVTAGVHGNAMRASRDGGSFYEPGTINILLLTNARLTPRAMTRALITATEAKTAALQDLDVRSSYQPRSFSATGTGTDNIIVAEGRGVAIDNTGGHSRMGELIARSVYAAVQKAVFLQNGLTPARNIFQRLKERHISMYELASSTACDGDTEDIAQALEEAFLHPRYAAFMKTAFVLSDAREAGRIQNLEEFNRQGLFLAGQIAGRPLGSLENLVLDDGLPPVLKNALNAMVNGVCGKLDH